MTDIAANVSFPTVSTSRIRGATAQIKLHHILFLCFTLISTVSVLFLGIWVQHGEGRAGSQWITAEG